MGKLVHEFAPSLVILRRIRQGLVPKGVRGLAGCKRLRHETNFNKRFHSKREDSVVNLVDVRKVVNRIALGIDGVDTDLIIENRVEANVFEIGNSLNFYKILSIAVAQRKDGTS